MANNVIMLVQAMWKIAVIVIWKIVRLLLPSRFVYRKNVAGEIVLITGSASGIGQKLAERFARLGARLVLWDINESGNAATKKMIEDIGAEVFTYTVDLSKREDVYRTAEQVKHDVGDVYILVNNAGVVYGKKIMDSSDEEIQKTMNINTTKALLGPMMETNHGHIVEIASIAGKYGVASLIDYCSSKHAVVGFAKSLAAEMHLLKFDGIHVTTICPFFVNTSLFKNVSTWSSVTLPLLTPEYVADKIIEAVVTNKDVVHLPKHCIILLLLKSILPAEALRVLEDYYQIHEFTEQCVG